MHSEPPKYVQPTKAHIMKIHDFVTIVIARKQVLGKVICLQACVCPQWGAWSGGGVHGPGGVCMVETPPPRRLLLRAVRILLECILVMLSILPNYGNLIILYNINPCLPYTLFLYT